MLLSSQDSAVNFSDGQTQLLVAQNVKEKRVVILRARCVLHASHISTKYKQNMGVMVRTSSTYKYSLRGKNYKVKKANVVIFAHEISIQPLWHLY